MKRLRHPIRAIREPFGTAGLIIAMIALVAALGGSALAANSALSGKQRKEVEKIAKKYAGKPGAPGATGPAGPAGAAGKNGNDGANGTNGIAGTNGTNGTPGEPWTPNSTLPEGATETGSVGASVNGSLAEAIVSFPIQLGAPLAGSATHFVTIAEVSAHTAPTQCPGTAEEPEAAEGNLCLYETPLTVPTGDPLGTEGATFFQSGKLAVGAGRTGSVLAIEFENPILKFVGTWAVTG